MKAPGVIDDVIGLRTILFLLLLLLLLLLGRSGATAPPDPSLEPQPRMGDGQALLPLESLKVSPQNQVGDGQPPRSRRRRRHGSHFPLCSYCCNCCRNRGCGLCCRT